MLVLLFSTLAAVTVKEKKKTSEVSGQKWWCCCNLGETDVALPYMLCWSLDYLLTAAFLMRADAEAYWYLKSIEP